MIIKDGDVTTYPSGRVRLKGEALVDLRRGCWERDHGWCQECSTATCYEPRYDGDPEGFDMAHIKSRGAGGSDMLSNVKTLCHECHMKEHNGKA